VNGQLIASINRVVIIYGSKEIVTVESPEIVQINSQTRRIGLKIKSVFSNIKLSGRNIGRLKTCANLRPVLWCPDPFKIGSNLHFSVLDISAGGFLLQTSKANKHLLPQMIIHHCDMYLPGIYSFSKISLKICAISSDDQNLFFNVKLDNPSEELITGIAQYAIFGTESASGLSADHRDQLQQSNLWSKKISKGLNTEIISTINDYNKVLEVRLIAYQNAKKLPDHANHEDMADQYDDHSVIIKMGYSGNVVGTIRVVKIDQPDNKLPCEQYFKIPTNDDRGAICEVSRLSLVPEFQGTDAIIGMFQHAISVALKAGMEKCYIVATDSLTPMYQRLGGVVVDGGVPHPHLQNENMSLLVLSRKNLLSAKNVAALAWDRVTYDVVVNLETYGFLKKKNFRFKIAFKRVFEKIALRAIRIFTKRRLDKK